MKYKVQIYYLNANGNWKKDEEFVGNGGDFEFLSLSIMNYMFKHWIPLGYPQKRVLGYLMSKFVNMNWKYWID